MENYKIIYSLKIMTQLVDKGFIPKAMMPNPRFPQFNCWIYEITPEFQKALDEVLDDGRT